ncbi:MAG: hypothetical protein WCG44_03405 [bacterium]
MSCCTAKELLEIEVNKSGKDVDLEIIAMLVEENLADKGFDDSGAEDMVDESLLLGGVVMNDLDA